MRRVARELSKSDLDRLAGWRNQLRVVDYWTEHDDEIYSIILEQHGALDGMMDLLFEMIDKPARKEGV